MQQKEGFQKILDTPNALGIISLGLSCDHVKIQTLVPMILAAVACLSSKGHQKVIDSMNYYQKQKNERVRFKKLVTSLKTEDDAEYKTNILRLINAIISRHDNLEKRTQMRQEFKLLGLIDIMEGLRYDNDQLLNAEIDGFLEEMEEDSKESMVNNVDLSDPLAITSALISQTHGKALQYFTEIMQQLFTIPVGTMEGLTTWQLAEDVVRSATAPDDLKSSKTNNNKQLDFKTIRKMKKSTTGSDELQTENQNAMLQQLNSLQDEIKNLKVQHLQEKNDLIDKYTNEKKEIQKNLETEILSLRDRLENATIQSNANVIENKQQNQEEQQPISTPPPPADNIPAPPPPGLNLPPPPPLGGGMGLKTNYSDKYPFKPSVQMKKFYWQPIRPNEISNTVWENTNFASITYLEPKELEKLFGATKKKDPSTDTNKSAAKENENPYQNMIDLKRSNNIGIMLKHFKLSPAAIKKAIIDVDEDTLSPEKISQLYRNQPTPEEIELLSHFPGDPRELGKSEQFLLQISSIPDINDRLELLQFRSTFDDEIEDLKHHFNTVITGTRQVLQSTLLGKMLELLLAIGNFMNYGQWKPPTSGFKLDFLTKVSDTRCGDNSLNMLHYVAGLISDKNPELLKIESELETVGNASRIPVSKLNTDVSKMNTMVAQMKRLLKKDAENTEMIRFREVLLSFSLHAKREIEIVHELKDQLQDLTNKIQILYPFAASLTLEESLGVISEFVLGFMVCFYFFYCHSFSLYTYFLHQKKSHNDNEQEQANKEMKERMAKKRKEREEAQVCLYLLII